MAYLHIYTGDGKGKTTCAVGLAVRALGAGMRVAFLQFDKGFEGNNEHYHERFILRQQPNLDLFFFGLERMMPDGKFRFANSDGDFEQARNGLRKAGELIRDENYQMVICDEAITCVGTRLYAESDLMALVGEFKASPRCELILTGRGAFPELLAAADLVTEMKLIKHYWYDHKLSARAGIDF
ncbi:MAG: cob(I)yrinic acid a,c-diamide adenosyltransferase [Candidatus Sumerlaeaceae bacterium]